IPSEDAGIFIIGASLPENSSTVRTQDFVDRVSETIREKNSEIASVTSITGINLLSGAFVSNAATFFVQLKPWEERERGVTDIIANVSQEFANDKDGTVQAVQPPPIPGLGISGGFTLEIQEHQAGDINNFSGVVGQFLGAANQRPEIGMAYTLFNSRTPSYRVSVNRDQVKKMGVSIGSVYSTIASNFGSSYINDFTRYGRNFRVVAQADTNYRNSIESLNNLYVPNVEGTEVPLNTMVSYKKEENPTIINHFNLFRSIQVGGASMTGYSSGDALTALEETAAQVLPEGYSYSFSGLSNQEKESGDATASIFTLIIIVVFLLL